jgi:hypothetical protein
MALGNTRHQVETRAVKPIAAALIAVVAIVGCSATSTASPASPTGSAGPNPLPSLNASLTGADLAIALVDRYENALVRSDWSTAWQMVAPGFREIGLDGDLARFSAERESYLATAGGRFVVSLRTNDPVAMRPWVLNPP